jgi:dihydrofolate reductase
MAMTGARFTLYIALSVDGFIATEDGGVEWLDAFQSETDGTDDPDSYEEFFADVDCLVMGSRTYEQILGFDEWPYGDRPTYVLTERELPQARDTVSFFDGSIPALAQRLEEQYDHIWVVGGAATARGFLRSDLLDELRLSFVPILLGSGIALFGTEGKRRNLKLLDTTSHENGIVELRYE